VQDPFLCCSVLPATSIPISWISCANGTIIYFKFTNGCIDAEESVRQAIGLHFDNFFGDASGDDDWCMFAEPEYCWPCGIRPERFNYVTGDTTIDGATADTTSPATANGQSSTSPSAIQPMTQQSRPDPLIYMLMMTHLARLLGLQPQMAVQQQPIIEH
jgi:hypothetical protein